jgi:hypothetical protein
VKIKQKISTVVWTLTFSDLNTMMFFFNPFYSFTFMCILLGMKKSLKNKLKLFFTAQDILRVHYSVSAVYDNQL